MHCTELESEDKMNIVVTDAKLWQHQVQTKIQVQGRQHEVHIFWFQLTVAKSYS